MSNVADMRFGLRAMTHEVGITSLLPLVSSFCPSTEEGMHPVRDFDVGPLVNFFDHAGNIFHGNIAALSVVIASSHLAEREGTTGDSKQQILATAVLGSSAAITVNTALESTPFFNESYAGSTDVPDAFYGSAAGILASLTFCAAALQNRRKRRTVYKQ